MESTFILFEEHGYDGDTAILAISAKSEEEAIQKLGAQWKQLWEPSEDELKRNVTHKNGMPRSVLLVPRTILEKYGIDCHTDLGTDTDDDDDINSFCIYSLGEVPTLE